MRERSVHQSTGSRLVQRLRARLGLEGARGLTLVEVLVSMLLLTIAMAMIVPLMSVVVTMYHRSTRTLSADSSQARLSLTFDRILQNAAPPSQGLPAVHLACPDAMELYSDAPLPKTQTPNGGGWVYIYLAPASSPTLPPSSGYGVYTLRVDELSSLYSPPSQSNCPESPHLSVKASILTIHDVVAPTGHGHAFFTYYNLGERGSSVKAEGSSVKAQGSSVKATQVFSWQTVPIAEIAYKITVRRLDCTVCSKWVIKSSPVESPKVTMQGTVILPNVLISEGQGAGLF